MSSMVIVEKSEHVIGILDCTGQANTYHLTNDQNNRKEEKVKKPMNSIMVIVCIVTFCCISSLVYAADKVIVVPLGSMSATAASSKIVHITFNGPNAASSCLDCYGVEMQGSGKVLAVQTWCSTDGGFNWSGDVAKNGTSVLTTRPQFLTKVVGTGVVRTDGTENFVQGDVLTFSTVEDSESINPIYPSVTAIIQYD